MFVSYKVRKRKAYCIGLFGITNAQIKYINNPPPPKRVRITTKSLIIVGSKSKYSAKPPHTPQSFLFVLERYNFFIVICFFVFANIKKIFCCIFANSKFY